MSEQPKKSFARLNYEICSPRQCNPDKGLCVAAPACSHKVIKQIDDAFEPPAIFQDMCMGCWDCIEACPLNAIEIHHVT
ncbi:MAG: 4Fe-4S binding protein [Thermodesulfobacteriota bacterium]